MLLSKFKKMKYFGAAILVVRTQLIVRQPINVDFIIEGVISPRDSALNFRYMLKEVFTFNI